MRACRLRDGHDQVIDPVLRDPRLYPDGQGAILNKVLSAIWITGARGTRTPDLLHAMQYPARNTLIQGTVIGVFRPENADAMTCHFGAALAPDWFSGGVLA